MPLLRDIVDQAAAVMSHVTPDEIYLSLDVRAAGAGVRQSVAPLVRNTVLINSLNRDGSKFYLQKRAVALTGNEPIEGLFLTLDWSDHDGRALLVEHPNLSSVEDEILNDGGIVNPFTSILLAFVDFRLRPYDVYFRDAAGHEVWFDKQDEDRYPPSESFRARRVVWRGDVTTL